MKRLAETLKRKDLLSVYYTASYPNIESTNIIRKHLAAAGADMVEIGIPFSDPVADGTVIQEANVQSISNGMSIRLLMQQLKECTTEVEIATVLMGYFNPIIQYGVEEFLASCRTAQIDGVIIPDLPVDIYEDMYQDMFSQHKISFIPIVTPSTSIKRLEYIHSISTSFMYLVSSSTTTGSSIALDSKQLEQFQATYKHLQLTLPVLIGFGIRNNQDFQHVCQYGNGGIIGSEFIRHLNKESDIQKACDEFVKRIKEI